MFYVSKMGSEVQVTVKKRNVYFEQIHSLNGYNILYIENSFTRHGTTPKNSNCWGTQLI